MVLDWKLFAIKSVSFIHRETPTLIGLKESRITYLYQPQVVSHQQMPRGILHHLPSSASGNLASPTFIGLGESCITYLDRPQGVLHHLPWSASGSLASPTLIGLKESRITFLYRPQGVSHLLPLSASRSFASGGGGEIWTLNKGAAIAMALSKSLSDCSSAWLALLGANCKNLSSHCYNNTNIRNFPKWISLNSAKSVNHN